MITSIDRFLLLVQCTVLFVNHETHSTVSTLTFTPIETNLPIGMMSCIKMKKKSTIKSSISITMIAGSMGAGKPIPSHFQFATSAKIDETHHMNVNTFAFFPEIKGKFGYGTKKKCPVTVQMKKRVWWMTVNLGTIF